MTDELTLANAALVFPSHVETGTLHIKDGVIADISQARHVPAGAVDCQGDFVAPGLIELHTDNIERHIHPRPKVDWPHSAAIVAHDAELASTGITTVFDALRVGSIPRGKKTNYGKYARSLASEILEMRDRDAFKISHFLHLRAEICSETLIEELAEFEACDRVGIVSLMDHMPGQRQFRDIGKYKAYMVGKYGMGDVDFETHVQELYDLHAERGARNEAKAVSEGKRLGAVLASHDDTTKEQVEKSKSHGVRLAEFPTTLEAAQACHAAEIDVIMGAPNLVRGGSHSGNVAAQDLAKADRLNILSSDYVPAALLMGAVQLGNLWGDMARGLATVTVAPAAAAGLMDRGILQPGLRGDVIRLHVDRTTPVLRGVWARGRQVA